MVLQSLETIIKRFSTKSGPDFRNICSISEERLESHPEILEELRRKVKDIYKSVVLSDFPPKDEKGSPKHFQGVWTGADC